MAVEPLDMRIINGRFVYPGGSTIDVLTIHQGKVVADNAQDVWRTINASGHIVLPGMIQPGDLNQALELVRGGVTTILSGEPVPAEDSSVDLVRTGTLPIETISPDASGHLTGDQWERLIGDNPVHFTTESSPGFPAMHFLYHEGHIERGMSLERIAEVTSRNIAQALGIQRRKGTFASDSDGDLFVFDPVTVDPYRDIKWPGRVIFSLMRGHILLYNGQIHTSAGDGIEIA